MILGAVFSLALLSATVTASSIPICIKDSSTTTSLTISSLSNYTTQFCTEISSSNFSSNAKNYNTGPTSTSIISLSFTSDTTSCLGDNSAANCEDVYKLLFSTCGTNNSTITGSGSINSGCGIYSFRLTSTNPNNMNATNASSKSGGGKTSGVSYCMVTGSVLLGVAAVFGWFL
ncbi:2abdb21b-b1c8-47e2-b2a9-4670012cb08b [Sclerotinia trifoliorum]|uniref:2abdb21b-b1c8-47e2-b2a9-4670012cb08b n=1 Tax=Sclerotinia trifoliorum TaxID=28548 RepID=A0A8H2W0I6_9HELO|nr:2abdb21b-b1c8-47e2-b2a9-4670012cb08b [Sclerotinia trifoliorum]